MGRHSRRPNYALRFTVFAVVSCVTLTTANAISITAKEFPDGSFATAELNAESLPEMPVYDRVPFSDGSSYSASQDATESTETAVQPAGVPLPTPVTEQAPPPFQDLDCRDFRTYEDAQAVLEANPDDPHAIDTDNDNKACEIYFGIEPAPVAEVEAEITLSSGSCEPYSGEGLLNQAALAVSDIIAATGFDGSILGRASRANSTSDHPLGLAADFMTTNRALGESIRDYALAHQERLAVKYVIWRQTYYPSAGSGEPMEDRGSGTANHYDHVHVSFESSTSSSFAPRC